MPAHVARRARGGGERRTAIVRAGAAGVLRRVALACAIVGIAAGCATTDADDANAAARAASRTTRAESPLAGSATGLRVLGWTVAVPSAGRGGWAGVLEGTPGLESPLDEAVARRLGRNGLAVVRLPQASVEALRARLVAARSEQDVALGQAATWRPLRAIRHSGRPMGLVVDGRVRRFEPGTLELLGRGWILPMEDGPVVQAELRAAHRSEDPFAAVRRGGSRRARDPEPVGPVDLAFLIGPGEAIMVLPVEPGDPIPGVAAAPGEGRGPSASGAGPAEARGEDRGAGDDAPAPGADTPPGPPVESPPTLGERLLAGGGGVAGMPVAAGDASAASGAIGTGRARDRIVLVLLPVIPDALQPPPLPASASGAAAGLAVTARASATESAAASTVESIAESTAESTARR